MNRWFFGFLLIVFALGCAKELPEWKGPPDREKAFPDMSFEDASPRRKASLKLTDEGFRESRGGMYVGAMKKFEQAIDIDPTNPFAYFHYGIARLNNKEYQQSIALLDEASEKFGRNERWLSRIYTYKGLSYKGLKDFESSRECFRKAIELDPKNEDARLNLIGVMDK